MGTRRTGVASASRPAQASRTPSVAFLPSIRSGEESVSTASTNPQGNTHALPQFSQQGHDDVTHESHTRFMLAQVPPASQAAKHWPWL